jgi:hypothetical protein
MGRTFSFLLVVVLVMSAAYSRGLTTQLYATSQVKGIETFADLVVPLGYPYESHYVTTQDGYILNIFRIQAKNSKMV